MVRVLGAFNRSRWFSLRNARQAHSMLVKLSVQLSGKHSPGFSDLHARTLPFEKLAVEPQFKGTNMSADRTRRNIERFSGFTEGVQPRSNFKRTQCIQWR